VPEHSTAFMAAMSGGEPFLMGPYLCIAAEDWLLAIGYPLENRYSSGGFEQALAAALRRRRPRRCWAICPELPERLKAHRRESDRYYILPAAGPSPEAEKPAAPGGPGAHGGQRAALRGRPYGAGGALPG
jgi:hypothetical protein